ncbi:MAG: EVE domain-containing protein [Candidatus Zixiibacteriota bacterium]
MPKRYWLFKSEPSEFSIDDLAHSPGQTAPWSGVRNYQSRNTLRDLVQVGDEVLFYHSSTDVVGVAGIAEVVRSGYPDHTARDRTNPYFDPKATEQNPIWFMVDVKFKLKLPDVIPLAVLRQTKGLEKMMVCQKGSRLSIQPVTAKEWGVIQKLSRQLD